MAGRKVLVVDDAAFMREMIKEIIIKNDFEVVGEAADGEEAVKKYKALKPDLVLMDITMPQMDGITALKEIKKEDSNAVVIMCSAMGQELMVVEAIQGGAKNFIVKPFKAEQLVAAMEKALQG